MILPHKSNFPLVYIAKSKCVLIKTPKKKKKKRNHESFNKQFKFSKVRQSHSLILTSIKPLFQA